MTAHHHFTFMNTVLSLLSALLLAPLAALHAADGARTMVGAIRWDGWYARARW